MARGRMITNQICMDKRVNALPDDTCRLVFILLITFADREGCVFGDPAVVRSLLFPRRNDISTDQVQEYLTLIANQGLIIWYEAKGDQWIWFPGFEKNQPGLRKDREPDSTIPPFNADTCRMIAGCLPDECPVKRKEEKRKENNPLPQLSGEELPAEEKQYLIDFLSIPGWQTFPVEASQSDAQDILALYRQHGFVKAHDCARWAFEKPRMSLRKVIRAMQTALPNWSMAPPGPNGNGGTIPKLKRVPVGPDGRPLDD